MTACTDRVDTPPGPSATTTRLARATVSSSTDEGTALYARYCAACHGPTGLAVASPWTPNLNSQGLLTVADDAFLHDNIALGRLGTNEEAVGRTGTKMPMFEGKLKPDEIQAIVGHLRSWQTEPSVPLSKAPLSGNAAAGAALYAANCAICHGADGWGEQAPRLAGATFQATASDAFIAHTIRHGRAGTRMLAFPLTDSELADLVAFIRTLGEDQVAP